MVDHADEKQPLVVASPWRVSSFYPVYAICERYRSNTDQEQTTKGGTKHMKGPIMRWDCPRKCGYYREWHESAEFLGMVIVHPLYGRVSEEVLIYSDISRHTCRQSWLARRRSPKGRVAASNVLPLQRKDRGYMAASSTARLSVGSIPTGA